MFSGDNLDEKRDWLKDIKQNLKNYQKQAYSANKAGLIKGKLEKSILL